MTIPVNLVGGGSEVRVTPYGELVTSALAPNVSRHHSMTAINTAYNFAVPIHGKVMRLQNILLYANKGVGTNDATVVVYTADAIDSLVAIETVMTLELPKYASRDLIGLNLELPIGVYLNAKTDDATVYATMMGYYTNDVLHHRDR